MKFTVIGRTMGDETTPFAVSDYNAKTIVEFINEVLEKKSEWGYIEVKDEPAGEFHWCTRIEYRNGELLDEIPAGLGKFYFCRVEDLKNNPDAQPIPLGEAVSIKPGMLTYKDDGDAKPYYSAKGFKATFTGTMEKPSDELMALLKKPLKWDVKLERQLERMPRKMKKAHRSDYSRNTKWIRKVANYLRRMTTYLRNGELVVTEEQLNRLSATIYGLKVQE